MENEASFGSPLTVFQSHYSRLMYNQIAVEAALQGAKDCPIPVHVMDSTSSDMRAVHVELLELRNQHSQLALAVIEKDEKIRLLEQNLGDLQQRNAALQIIGFSTRTEAKSADDLHVSIAALQDLNSQLAEEYEILRRNVEFGFVADARELQMALDASKSECEGLAGTNSLLANALLELQNEILTLRETLQNTTKELELQQRRVHHAEKDLRELRAAEVQLQLQQSVTL